ncbi:MAG: hypothetical protein KIT86_13710 [Hydrogenophaga sp.]|uniref:hypothetical protein n=1 Tax=Hydrogenophaga sp. TaxID=1904254 RepID=UPI00260ABF00|nr:hypothetical protein [Hydrogenophaga sp.]MCW5670718.1 hypothetical protein [Hydrogenophaga sp.]
MTLFWRMPPTGPTRARSGLFLGCALALASAHAQPLDALGAADPARPVTAPPLVLPATGQADLPALPTDIAAARAIWQRANQRVAEFARGHADLLRWESAQAGQARAEPRRGPVLDLAQALRLSLRHRPELFTHADMNPLAQREVAVAYAAHVRDVRRAWIDAVTARQSERLLAEVLDATRTGSELGRRMVVAGNWSQARQMREQLIEATAWQASVNARSTALAAQERLARLLGLWDAQAVAQLGEQLPTALPELPATAPAGEGVSEATHEAAVLRSHPTLAQARLLAGRDIALVSPARRQAWDEAVDAALGAVTGADSAPPRIDNLSLLRDHTLERAVQAQAALLRQAAQRRSMARLAWTELQVRHASALHAQNVVAQLHSALEQETQLRYNGMLQSTWDLLASARERMGAIDAALQARRGYWLAQADWQALLAGADDAGPDTPSSSSGNGTAAAAGH